MMMELPKNNVPTNVAVSVRGARHLYHELTPRGPRQHTVLDDVNITVYTGQIYALLGSSGCGKTTLIRALVGQIQLNAGEITAFGKASTDPDFGIPGNLVGYMPQDLALHDRLTIGETMCFFAMLAGMDYKHVSQSVARVFSDLDLPDASRIVGTLSGGQKRRLSFAVAVLHSPPLLILDEPTVGVDPLLRNRLWCALVDLAKNRGTTVILTTHYIQEAEQATVIGVMRHGKMVVEESPKELASRSALGDLEDAVYQLCVNQESHHETVGQGMYQITSQQKSDPDAHHHQSSPRLPSRPSRPRILRALLWKNLAIARRSVESLLMMAIYTLALPLLATTCVRYYPHGMTVGVVNEDADCSRYLPHHFNCSDHSQLSCQFLSLLRKQNLTFDFFESKEAAEAAVRAGSTWGVVHFPPNYTQALVARVREDPLSLEDSTIFTSTVDARLDMSDGIVSSFVMRRLAEATRDLVITMEKCTSDGVSTSSILRINDPIFGMKEPSSADDQLPALALGPLFLFCSTLGLVALLTEKQEKSLERSVVSGVTMGSVLISYGILYMPIILFLTVLKIVVLFGLLRFSCLGSLYVVFLILMIFNIFGLLYGMVCAMATSSFALAIMLVQSAFFTFNLFSGTMWPREGMHWILTAVADYTPMMQPCMAVKGIVARGWTIWHPVVSAGIRCSAIWTAITLLILIVWTLWRFKPCRCKTQNGKLMLNEISKNNN